MEKPRWDAAIDGNQDGINLMLGLAAHRIAQTAQP